MLSDTHHASAGKLSHSSYESRYPRPFCILKSLSPKPAFWHPDFSLVPELILDLEHCCKNNAGRAVGGWCRCYTLILFPMTEPGDNPGEEEG